MLPLFIAQRYCLYECKYMDKAESCSIYVEMFATHEVIIAKMLNCSEFSVHRRNCHSSKSGNQEAKSGKYWQKSGKYCRPLTERHRYASVPTCPLRRAWYSTVQYSTVQYSTVQYSTVCPPVHRVEHGLQALQPPVIQLVPARQV